MKNIKEDIQAVIQKARQAQDQALSTGKTSLTTYEVKKSLSDELEKRGIYRRYHNCTFEEIERQKVPNQIKNQYQQVKAYADRLPEHVRDGIGLILKGPVGTMKTSLALAVLRQWLEGDHGGQFIAMVSLLDTIFTLKDKNKELWVKFEDQIRNTQLLILDDLGTEYHQEWVLSKVDSIISERYNRMLPTIITTNLSNKDLKGKYAERIIDRLRSTSQVINFYGQSLRSVYRSESA